MAKFGGANYGIYSINADGSDVLNLTANQEDWAPSWSPDGSRIAFYSYRDIYSAPDLYLMNADGSNPQVVNNSNVEYFPDWSQSGDQIAALNSGRTLYIYDLATSGTVRITTFTLDAADWSADGADFTFGSSKDGAWDIYRMKADGTQVERLTNDAAVDRYPAWEP